MGQNNPYAEQYQIAGVSRRETLEQVIDIAAQERLQTAMDALDEYRMIQAAWGLGSYYYQDEAAAATQLRSEIWTLKDSHELRSAEDRAYDLSPQMHEILERNISD